MPRQCVPLRQNGLSEEQNGSIVGSKCIKSCPSTSSAPTTTTAGAPNCAFGMSPGIPQRCCGRPRTLRASHTPPVLYMRVSRPTNAAPLEVCTSSPSNTPGGGGIPQALPKWPCSGFTSHFHMLNDDLVMIILYPNLFFVSGSLLSANIPGRSDNDVKNRWNSRRIIGKS